jgi:hypothetical protein
MNKRRLNSQYCNYSVKLRGFKSSQPYSTIFKGSIGSIVPLTPDGISAHVDDVGCGAAAAASLKLTQACSIKLVDFGPQVVRRCSTAYIAQLALTWLNRVLLHQGSRFGSQSVNSTCLSFGTRCADRWIPGFMAQVTLTRPMLISILLVGCSDLHIATRFSRDKHGCAGQGARTLSGGRG